MNTGKKPNKLIDVQSIGMPRLQQLLFLSLCMLLVLPARAQFKSLKDKADKQYELKAFNLAIKSYRDALRERPENVEALFRLADAYRHVNDMEAAAEWFGRALQQRKVDPRAHLYFGHVLKALGRYDEAYFQYKQYVKTDPVAGEHFAASANFAKSMLSLAPQYEVRSEAINTPSSEFGAAFRGDGLVYASSRRDIQLNAANWTGTAYNQVFFARNDPQTGMLSNPIFLPTIQENAFNLGPMVFEKEGGRVIFTRNNFVEGTRLLESSGLELNLYEAEVQGDGYWMNIVPFQYNMAGYATGFPALSPDGQQLYFASNRPDGYGGFDLYVSNKVGGKWGVPENMGPVINSPGNEITPFFDGNVMYFSSDWHNGLGGYDVFRARRNNNRWVEVVNEGLVVNTSRDDYGFVSDPIRGFGFLTSNRAGGRGAEDIYRVEHINNYLVIQVKSAADGSPVGGAELDFGACGNGVMLADARGMYRFKPAVGQSCDLVIRKDGFEDVRISLQAGAGGEGKTIQINMSRIGEAFVGQVLDIDTRQPVEGVTVFATHLGTGSYLASLTDASGKYTLALGRDQVYQVRYLSSDYREMNRTVRTTGTDRDVLGVVSMIKTSRPGLTEKGGEGGEEGVIVSGFAVQVMALKTPKMEMFERLRSIGVVYTVREKDLTKVRVGVYTRRPEAEVALLKIKQQGYPSAFIVEEKGTRLDPEMTEKATEGGGYAIQLGAYRDPQNFDGSKVNQLGVVTERKKGNLTIKMLSGFTTEQAARGMLPRVKSAGFPGAFVVKSPN